ncbi:MBL fold metallo-hydrolase [Priestia filamentosa]|uniref:MBL fold metallo-hydrolase n=1 Tax=Priestia filamentosa TaxID=1402861 RepID=UPI00234955B8|nr:MBL fold metallo-hydrolase [Priestia filamentosa]WCM17381.1 MBL fold metallo-hydrolase [Priestia filamentosa]
MIHSLKIGRANVFVIQEEKTIIVDTGSPKKSDFLLQSLYKLGVTKNSVSLILLTHGHLDHFGNINEIRSVFNAPVAIHREDVGALEKGQDSYLKPTRKRGALIKPFLHGKIKGTSPDMLIDTTLSLKPFGVNGKVVHTPGHTDGSLSVILKNKEMIIGDLLMGGHIGGFFLPHKPRHHYFAHNMDTAQKSIQRLLHEKPSKIYVGHGGPLTFRDIQKREF